MKKSKNMLIVMMCILGLSLLLAGCQTSKKPMTPSNNQKPNMTTPANPNGTGTTTNTGTASETRQMAARVEKEAKMVSGVRSATAVISGKTIYVGLDVDANLDKAKTTKVEKEVIDRVKQMESTYTVMASSDVDTVTRIKKVAQGIAAGKPLSTFSKEMQDIGSRMKPTTK